jgi:hypothetical protein
MANHKRLLAVIDYIVKTALDPRASFDFDVSDDTDGCGNRKVEISIKSRVPAGAAVEILKGRVEGNALHGFGAVKTEPRQKTG